jgi:hypothetical protein
MNEPSPIRSHRAGLPLEVAAVWLLYAVMSVVVFSTYSRVDPEELYHVSGSGIAGGLGRVLVLLNWPIALVAIAVLAVLAERGGRWTAAVAVAGIVLCAAVAWPGMVDEADLDAKPANAIAALGVGVALALSLLAWRAGGIERTARLVGDPVRAAVAIAALVLAIPWILADLGLSVDGVPLLGSVYQTGELLTEPGDPVPHPAVHHGHHHGMDGAMLVLTALLLSRLLPGMRTAWVRAAAGAYLALMLCYGAGNLANDFWLEQVVKRGWADWEIPDVTVPKLSVAWGLIVLCAALLWAFGATRSRRSAATGGGAREPPPVAA